MGTGTTVPTVAGCCVTTATFILVHKLLKSSRVTAVGEDPTPAPCDTVQLHTFSAHQQNLLKSSLATEIHQALKICDRMAMGDSSWGGMGLLPTSSDPGFSPPSALVGNNCMDSMVSGTGQVAEQEAFLTPSLSPCCERVFPRCTTVILVLAQSCLAACLSLWAWQLANSDTA